MVNLTNKEVSLLEGEKYQQQLAIDKYSNFAIQAEDPILKNVFSNFTKIEEEHLYILNEVLKGKIPKINNRNLHPYYEKSNNISNDYLNIGNIILSSFDNNSNESDKIICFDALNTEELLHSTYSASSIEFENTPIKDVFQTLIKEKEENLQYLNDYMIKKGMYNNTIYF